MVSEWREVFTKDCTCLTSPNGLLMSAFFRSEFKPLEFMPFIWNYVNYETFPLCSASESNIALCYRMHHSWLVSRCRKRSEANINATSVHSTLILRVWTILKAFIVVKTAGEIVPLDSVSVISFICYLQCVWYIFFITNCPLVLRPCVSFVIGLRHSSKLLCKENIVSSSE